LRSRAAASAAPAALDDPSGRGRRRGEHDAVAAEVAAVDDGFAREGDPGVGERADEGLHERRHPTGQRPEHWCGRVVGRWSGAQTGDERGRALGGRGQLWRGGAHRETVAVAGVDPAEERVDEVLEDVVAEARPDQRADARVLVGRERRAGQVRLGRDPLDGFGSDERRAP
jgi:hypothetical protein